MAKKSFNQDSRKPFDYFSEVKATQKQDKPNVGNLVTTLRSDMVPASDAEPAKKSILERDNIRAALGILLCLVILGLILFILIGPGRPILERNLASLAHTAATDTTTSTVTPHPTGTLVQPSSTPLPATKTPYSSPTSSSIPTSAEIAGFITSPTAMAATSVPAAAVNGCRDVTSITLADVGQTLCVRGIVIETVTHPKDFMVVFSDKVGAFYWVTYDLVWSQAELNSCYQITGKIDQIANSPVLVFNYHNFPEVCP